MHSLYCTLKIIVLHLFWKLSMRHTHIDKIVMNTLVYDRSVGLNRVEQAVNDIMERHKEEGIPICKICRAPARLTRRGISLIITLFMNGKKEIVPLRVEDEDMARFRYCTDADLKSWRGKWIQCIRTNSDAPFKFILNQVKKCLRTAFNRFKHKLERNAHKMNVHLRKKCSRERAGDSFRPRTYCVR